MCNGALLPIQNWQALFSLIGTYYGGDGVRTFGLPDLRGRAILGTDTRDQYPAGMLSGETGVQLNTQQIPAHSHMIQASSTPVSSRGEVAPTNNIFAGNTEPPSTPKKIFLTAGSGETPLTVGTNVVNDGGNQPHNNIQPYLAINYLIALQGTYPSRN